MPSRAATFSNVTAFNARAYGARDYRRTIFGGAVLGLGGVSAAAVMAGTVAVAAAWMVSGSLARNPQFRARAPFALEAALPQPPRRLVDPPDMFGGALASANQAYVPNATPQPPVASAAAPPPPTPATMPSPLHSEPSTAWTDVPLPAPRPPRFARVEVKPDLARAPTLSAAPAATAAHLEPAPAHEAPRPLGVDEQKQEQKQIAALAFGAAEAPDTTGSIGAVKPGPPGTVAKPASPRLAYNNPDTPSVRDSRTAIYDIVAHTVYMPDGERLEAHSGLGRMLDDPHYVSRRGRGPTPPNTYDLTLRGGSFHGVQAIRLNPVADAKMFGRDGILAHTYMLGPSGQSFGCVSFKNYSQFLRAFQRGEVNRMIVVPHLQSPPPGVRADRDSGKRYAFNSESVR